MREVKYYCDHCKKEINGMNDYIGEIIWDEIEADLCCECFTDLNDIILKFVKKEGEQK